MNALHIAAQRGFADVLEFLLEVKQDSGNILCIDEKIPESNLYYEGKSTPLHFAA